MKNKVLGILVLIALLASFLGTALPVSAASTAGAVPAAGSTAAANTVGAEAESLQGVSAAGDWSLRTIFQPEDPDSAGAGLTLAAATGGTITGTVYDDKGNAIQGATVAAFYNNTEDIIGTYLSVYRQTPGFQTTTGANGNFILPVTYDGQYVISAFHSGYARFYYPDCQWFEGCTPVSVSGGQYTTGIDFHLAAGGTISGQVKDQSTGNTLGQVSVCAFISSDNELKPAAITQTGSSGNYTLDGLSLGDYFVLAPVPGNIGLSSCGTGDGMYASEFWQEKPLSGASVSPDVVSVTETVNPAGINFTLEKGGSVSGRICDYNGQPVMAAVSVFEYSSLSGQRLYFGFALTNEEGYYKTPNLPAGQFALRAIADGYLTQWYNPERPVYGPANAAPVTVTVLQDTADISFTLSSGGISGRVTSGETGNVPCDSAMGSIYLNTGWHHFVYRYMENTGSQVARVAFKSPSDNDWRFFSTSNLAIKTSLEPGAETGILLTTKQSTWVDKFPKNYNEMVQCVDVDSLSTPGWYGQSVVEAVNQTENINGDDDHFTAYYEAYFYVPAGQQDYWQFSTDSDDASEIDIGEKVIASWYGGHGAMGRWEYKGRVTITHYPDNAWVTEVGYDTEGYYSIKLPPGDFIVQARAPGFIDEYYNQAVSLQNAVPVTVGTDAMQTGVNFALFNVRAQAKFQTNYGYSVPGDSFQNKAITVNKDWGTTVVPDSVSLGNVHLALAAGSKPDYLNPGADKTSVPPNYTWTFGTVSPGEWRYVNGGFNDNPVSYTPGFSVTRSISPEVLVEDGIQNLTLSVQTEQALPNLFIDIDIATADDSYAQVIFVPLTEIDDSISFANDGKSMHISLSDLPSGQICIYNIGLYLDLKDAVSRLAYAPRISISSYEPTASGTVVGSNAISRTEPGLGSWTWSTDRPVVWNWHSGISRGVYFNSYSDIGSISGLVLDESGRPVEGARINVHSKSYGTSTQTDSAGAYTCHNLPEGSYWVDAWKSGYAREYWQSKYTSKEATLVTIDGTQDIGNINFSLEPGGTISGTVYSVAGEPLSNISVNAAPADGSPIGWGDETDSAGQFEITGVPYGSYKIFAPCGWGSSDVNYAREYYHEQKTWDAAGVVILSSTITEAGNINFSLEEGGNISGRVYKADGKTPLAGAYVALFNSNDPGTPVYSMMSREDGRYSFNPVKGSYRVLAVAEGYAQQWWEYTPFGRLSTVLTVDAGTVFSGIDFWLQAGGTISGKVTAGTGSIAGMLVKIQDINDPDNWWAPATGSSGEYRLNVPNGNYIVYAPFEKDDRAGEFVRQYYNGASSVDAASTVIVSNAAGAGGINFNLALTPICIKTLSLPDGEYKVTYGPVTLEAVNGTAPYTWSKSGDWPAGLALNAATGAISGKPGKKPKTATDYTFTIRVTDKDGNTISKEFTITVYPAISLTAAAPGEAEIGAPYPVWTPQASGGNGSYTWEAANLPAGLSIDASTGKISGTPAGELSVAATYNILLTAKDSLGGSAAKKIKIKVYPAITVTTPSLPNDDVGVKYKQTLKAAGGNKKYTWSVLDNSLPPWLELSAKGVLTGIPPAGSSGNYSINFVVSDNLGKVSAMISLTVNPALNIKVDPAFPATASVGQTCNFVLTASGGSGTGYKWSKSGSLPAGLKLDVKNGTITGTFKTAKTYKFTIKLTDSLKGSLIKEYTIIVQ
jgi:hypothetical protein